MLVATEATSEACALPIFIGSSDAARRLAREAARVLASESPIFIFGETGAGKGMLASWIQSHGSRAREPFVDVNCATLGRELLESELFGYARGAFTGAVHAKPGLLETAHRGTLFLDEIGDLDLNVQPKLLKVLEEKRFRPLGDVVDRPVDVRLIAATHQDLSSLVEQGRFRPDLYYRICILPLSVPPLRERREDIPLLAQYFAHRIGHDLGRREVVLTPEAITLLQRHSWPGNIRELRNAIERALLVADLGIIDRQQLAFLGREERSVSSSGLGRAMTLTEAERSCIEEVLRDAGGRVEVAALRLGISRSSLYNKMKKHGLVSRRAASTS